MSQVRGRSRISFVAVAVGGVLLAAGCMHYGSIRPGVTPARETPVQVYFSEPRHLRFRSATGETLDGGSVRELTGRVAAVSGDTLDVYLQSVNRRPPPVSGAFVQFVPAARDRVETQQLEPVGTAVLMLLALALVGFLAWLGSVDFST